MHSCVVCVRMCAYFNLHKRQWAVDILLSFFNSMLCFEALPCCYENNNLWPLTTSQCFTISIHHILLNSFFSDTQIHSTNSKHCTFASLSSSGFIQRFFSEITHQWDSESPCKYIHPLSEPCLSYSFGCLTSSHSPQEDMRASYSSYPTHPHIIQLNWLSFLPIKMGRECYPILLICTSLNITV